MDRAATLLLMQKSEKYLFPCLQLRMSGKRDIHRIDGFGLALKRARLDQSINQLSHMLDRGNWGAVTYQYIAVVWIDILERSGGQFRREAALQSNRYWHTLFKCRIRLWTFILVLVIISDLIVPVRFRRFKRSMNTENKQLRTHILA